MHPGHRDDPITRRLVFLGKQLREWFGDMLEAHDCTIPTWAVLRSAHLNPGLSQVQLATHIGIEGPTLTRQLDRLCDMGLVERKRDPLDRRVVRVFLTSTGEARWSELAGVAGAMEARLTRNLTKAQLTALDKAITSIHEALEDTHAPLNARR